MRWLDGISDSMDISLSNSGNWWRTGKPGMLQSMGSQRVRHDWATELTEPNPHWGGQPALLSLLTQMSISTGNTLMDTPRIMFNQISAQPMVQSNWHVKLIITSLLWKLCVLGYMLSLCNMGPIPLKRPTSIKTKRKFVYLWCKRSEGGGYARSARGSALQPSGSQIPRFCSLSCGQWQSPWN